MLREVFFSFEQGILPSRFFILSSGDCVELQDWILTDSVKIQSFSCRGVFACNERGTGGDGIV